MIQNQSSELILVIVVTQQHVFHKQREDVDALPTIPKIITDNNYSEFIVLIIIWNIKYVAFAL